MPSNLALILCLLFIFIVFIIDFKQNSYTSVTLWIPWVWMFFCASKSITRWLNPTTPLGYVISGDYISGDPIERTVLAVLMLFGLIILFKKKIKWSQVVEQNIYLIIFFLWMGASIFWSDFPLVSLKRWFRLIGDLIMVMVILTEPQPVKAIRNIFRRIAFVLLPLSILFIKYFRNIGVAFSYFGVERWAGVTTHKNNLGELALLCSLFFIWNIITLKGKKRAFLDILFLSMALFLLVGSKSMTSLIGFIIGIIIIITLFSMKKRINELGSVLFIIPLIGLIISILFIVLLTNSAVAMIFSGLGRDMTFTGRTDLWRELIKIASQHPILGAGYGSFWIGDISHNLWSTFTWRPNQGHNGYIDIYLELGAVGLIILVIIIVYAYRNIVRKSFVEFDYGALLLIFLIVIVAHNLTESSFVRPNRFLWFIFLLVTAYVPKSKEQYFEEKAEIVTSD